VLVPHATAAAAAASYSRQMAAEVCAPALLAGSVTKPGGHLLQVGCCLKPRLYLFSPHGTAATVVAVLTYA
jgi:hypothetical protein